MIAMKGQYGNLQKFVESYNVHVTPEQITTFNEPKLVESAGGQQLGAFLVLHNVPFSKYTAGLNGRVYEKELWEMHLPSMEGLPAHDSHLDDPKPSDTIGVWHNFHMDENYPYGDLYITNEQIARNIANGLRTLGISTSAFGEMLPGSDRVNKESFVPQSIDAVYNPSMQVFLNQEQAEKGLETKKESVIKESIHRGNTMESKGRLDEVDYKIKENQYKSQVTTLARAVTQQVKESDLEGIKLSEERAANLLQIFQETSVLPEQQEKLKETLETIKSFYDNHLAESTATLEGLKESVDKAEGKIKEQTEIIDAQKREISTLSEALDSLSKDGLEDEIVEKVTENIKGLSENIFELEESNKALTVDKTAMTKIIKTQKERMEIYQEKIEKLKQEKQEMVLALSYANAKLKEAEDRVSKKEKVEESIKKPEKKVEVNPVVKEFTESVLEETPFLKHFEDRIVASKDLKEAMKLVKELKKENKLEESAVSVGSHLSANDDFVPKGRY
jgi:hypothetical protein